MSVGISCAVHFKAQKMLWVVIKFDPHAKVMLDFMFKSRLDKWVGGEVKEVIYIETDVEGRMSFENCASEQAWGIYGGCEP